MDREIKIINWPTDSSKNKWVVSVNPTDGSYYPIAEVTADFSATIKTNLQTAHDMLRRLYVMESKITHTQFYEWLSAEIGVRESDLPVSLDEIRASTDPHLNDIPLVKWDKRDPVVRGKAVRAGMRSWSLSDSVCCLKATALKLAGKTL